MSKGYNERIEELEKQVKSILWCLNWDYERLIKLTDRVEKLEAYVSSLKSSTAEKEEYERTKAELKHKLNREIALVSQKTFTAKFRIVVIVGGEVKADTLEEALQKAKEIKETDIFKVFGEYGDGSSFQLIGVPQYSLWNID